MAGNDSAFQTMLNTYLANNKVAPKDLQQVISTLKATFDATAAASSPAKANTAGKTSAAPAAARAKPVAKAKPIKAKDSAKGPTKAPAAAKKAATPAAKKAKPVAAEKSAGKAKVAAKAKPVAAATKSRTAATSSKASAPATAKKTAPAKLAADNAPFMIELPIASESLRKSRQPRMLGIRAPNDPYCSIKASIHRDYLVCLEDGKKLKMLKRHLRSTYGAFPETYRAKFGLPPDYPMGGPRATARAKLDSP